MDSITGVSRTILGPLTTVFTPPPLCTTVFAETTLGSDDGFYVWRAQTCYHGSGGEASSVLRDNSDCWPTPTTGVSAPYGPFLGWGFYSPGLLCPQGYSRACTAVAGAKTEWPAQFVLDAGETAVGCCPQ
jgi:hypothetical protein